MNFYLNQNVANIESGHTPSYFAEQIFICHHNQ